MKVMHVHKATGIGGSERHLLTLLPALEQARTTTGLCALVGPGHAAFLNPLRDVGIDVFPVPAGPHVNVALVSRVSSVIRAEKPDLIHTHNIHGDVYGQLAAALSRVPAVSSKHGTYDFFRRQPYKAVERFAGRLAKRTIAISEHVARFVREVRQAPADRIRVVPYGIDVSRWSTTEAERAAQREKWGLSPENIAVGIASRLVPFKGHELVIDAVAKALRVVPSIRLLIAGEGPLRCHLERYALSKLPRDVAVFLGFVSDIRRFMSGCDVVAVPAQPEFGEGFGLVALEAMAAGRPVLTTDVASLPEVVIHEETGIVVPPYDVEAIANALHAFAEPLRREQLGRQARTRASEVFTTERMVRGTLSVYREALGDDA